MASIVVMCGPPCSGKTTLSTKLSELFPMGTFPRFEMDQIRISLNLANTAENRARAYAHMHDLAADALRRGTNGVILDATYQPPQQRRAIEVLSARTGASVCIFECKVDPKIAVDRFLKRSDTHAADDLSPEAVWDSAHANEYKYYKWATPLEGESSPTAPLAAKMVETIFYGLNYPNTPSHIEEWIALRDAPSPPPAQKPTVPKLNERSRQLARLDWLSRRLAASIATIFWLAGLLLGLLILVKVTFNSGLLDASWLPDRIIAILHGSPADWILVWVGLGGFPVGLFAVWDTFVFSERAKLVKSITKAGQVPRLDLAEISVNNATLYRRYLRRLPPNGRERMPIEGLPLWFLVPPRKIGFEVCIEKIFKRRELDHEYLTQQAAKLGLDWAGFRKWQEQQIERQYSRRYNEKGLRALGITISKQSKDRVVLEGCEGDYMSYACTELSANLGLAGRYGFTIREILEGPLWRAWEHTSEEKLDLGNVAKGAATHEMLVGVQVALTTADYVLLLQRRSDLIQSAAGGVGASGAGTAKWNDGDWLSKSALRETHEELNWRPDAGDDIASPFLGAAFSLLRGRDLNFYCHFHTRKTLCQISEKATHAQDAWEVAHLIPIPVESVLREGKLEPHLDSLMGGSRHIRGLLYCLAQSEKFLALQDAALKKWGLARLRPKAFPVKLATEPVARVLKGALGG